MITSLNGEIIDLGSDFVVVECAGVGYRAQATTQLLSTLRRGDTYRILTTLITKDDGQFLYAFESEEAREVFALLISVSGVGPKIAMLVLSAFGFSGTAEAIKNSDSKKLQTVSGVGKRVADRLIVDLGSKMDAYIPAATPAHIPEGGGEPSSASISHGDVATVAEALIGLGFPESAATAAATTAAQDGGSHSDILKRALNLISKK